MQIIHPTPDEARLGLRAIKTVLIADGVLNPAEAHMLVAAQKYITRTDFDVHALPAIEPDALAAGVQRPELRQQLIGAMVIHSFASGEAGPEQLDAIRGFAQALGVELAEIETLQHYVRRNLALFRFDILRHMYIGDALAGIWHEEGVKGILKLLGGLAGLREDPALAAKYQALGDYAEGTLGRALYDHYRSHGFALPGEKHGGPPAIVLHDTAHVLGGYETDPDGEFQVAAFTAGFRSAQSWSILIFVMCQFDLGVRIAPVPGGVTEIGRLDPDRLLAALVRGTRMKVDLFDDWDFWAAAPRPLAELRVEYGIDEATPAR
ncbi:MAG: hypothetical protein KC620_22935 [Myxococcales bacterium]|nr:hypothetical protein [Myxococcales bacterium]